MLNFRVITGKTTLPAGTAGAGTVSTNAVNDKTIDGTGTNFKTLMQVSATNVVSGKYFLFVPDDDVLLPIKDVISDTMLILSEDAPAITNKAYQIVSANLTALDIKNGNTAVTLNGASFPANAELNLETRYRADGNAIFYDAILINGTGGSVFVTEIR